MSDYEKMGEQIYQKMIDAYKKEEQLNRHPAIKIESYSPGTKLTRVTISSDQILEHLELRPSEYEVFVKMLAENGIDIQK